MGSGCFRAWSEGKANNYEDTHWNCDCGLNALLLPIKRIDGTDCLLSYSYQCLSPQGLWTKFTRRSNIKEASEEAPSSRDIPFFYTYLYVSCICVQMHAWEWCVHAVTCMWRLEDNFCESVPLSPCGFQDWAQILGFRRTALLTKSSWWLSLGIILQCVFWMWCPHGWEGSFTKDECFERK